MALDAENVSARLAEAVAKGNVDVERACVQFAIANPVTLLQRGGKWPEEEVQYGRALAQDEADCLLDEGVGRGLREFIAGQLCCPPMRITKKMCTGKVQIRSANTEASNFAPRKARRHELHALFVRRALLDASKQPPAKAKAATRKRKAGDNRGGEAAYLLEFAKVAAQQRRTLPDHPRWVAFKTFRAAFAGPAVRQHYVAILRERYGAARRANLQQTDPQLRLELLQVHYAEQHLRALVGMPFRAEQLRQEAMKAYRHVLPTLSSAS